eukprot:CAMPEP_0185856534 /NCGR_PEP_ID=MMETSP1354-20130828/29048_1 /TAXON_ID=708628 /ORGANISM="Erythrolobus madagascarensis, Strain CCMP3276" /LENGTH=570 /DNA_ID=CAMNT_0028558791 /DNA_START=901 /DNA_END=2613 /DNA_ORIENTATION=+
MSRSADRRPPLDLSALPQVDHLVAKEYDVFLGQLTFNSKELINALTRIAEENKAVCPVIAFVLDSRILSSPPDKKLPLVYLLDSILKNVTKPYRDLFGARVHELMPRVYGACSTDVRTRLQKLVATWPPFFGPNVVNFILAEFGKIDVAQRNSVGSSALYANPEYARPHAQSMAAVASAFPQPSVSTLPSQAVAHPFATRPQHEHQPAPPSSVPSSVQPPYASSLADMESETRALMERINYDCQRGQQPPVELVTRLQTLIASQMQLVAADHRKRHNLELLSRNIAVLLPGGGVQPAAASFPGQKPPYALPQSSQRQPTIAQAHEIGAGAGNSSSQLCSSFNDIKSSSHAAAVRLLYDDLKHIARNDGSRFATKDQLRTHLDWLFEHQKRKRSSAAHSRTWFASQNDWCNNVKDVALSGADVAAIFENAAASKGGAAPGASGGAAAFGDELAAKKARGIKRTSAGTADGGPEEGEDTVEASGDGDEVCGICGEPFESEWIDSRQAWILQGAIKVGEEIYHKRCHRVTSPIAATRVPGKADGGESAPDQIVRAAKKSKVEHGNSAAEVQLT